VETGFSLAVLEPSRNLLGFSLAVRGAGLRDTGVAGLCAAVSQAAGRCGEMWGDVGRCGEMWGDAGRCGETWGDMGRHGETDTGR